MKLSSNLNLGNAAHYFVYLSLFFINFRIEVFLGEAAWRLQHSEFTVGMILFM
jgi:hypothetical protein